MIKFKHLFYTAIIGTLLYACGSDSNSVVDNFDHEAQALKDKDSIAKFLKNYYFDDTIDSIKPIVAGKTPLSEDTRLIKKTHTENDIEYDLYHLVIEEGQSPKGNPTELDSVLTNYQVWYTTKVDQLELSQTGTTPIWWNLTLSGSQFDAPTPIRGWTLGIPNFKAGINTSSQGEPISYDEFGKGILIVPSGLAYRNSVNGGIPANSQLIFYIDLFDFVEDTDHDRDGVASINEDLDGDGNPRNDDTDKDNIPNYLDTDDDGDGVLSKDEDKNGDGNPANDFSDPNKPTIPDYLNRDIF
ncbi:peptidylprolyl isomerase [Tenacibaculum sp. 1_MG-2023]|uniref:FKBP-type peptidyl-prolyl cis-trans isomerase n=1 Tax=Tenacibaculum sp. 1_MG-2023 TaxID=3062653 RepID=UPI0026E47D48|nr:peptidylprolyl isomerase [Tenacibaculum sp. 1_MG-2023]MDO6675691.1 peptidylprolyl isomerase [Tenacibaculum sp. 1_MG-2023]